MKTGLVLIDLQNDYFPGGRFELFQAEYAVAQAKRVLDRFRELNLPVFHIRHINLREGATFFLPNTTGAKIHPAVAPDLGEVQIVKYAPDAFFQTDLNDQLVCRQVEHLVVCGMMTHMCVDTTVRAARNFGYGVTLIEDACSTRMLNRSDVTVAAPLVQAAFMAALDGTFAQVVSTDAWLVQNDCISIRNC